MDAHNTRTPRAPTKKFLKKASFTNTMPPKIEEIDETDDVSELEDVSTAETGDAPGVRLALHTDITRAPCLFRAPPTTKKKGEKE